jgi:hypothetical protein
MKLTIVEKIRGLAKSKTKYSRYSQAMTALRAKQHFKTVKNGQISKLVSKIHQKFNFNASPFYENITI